jgi:hypothetical protein
MEKVTTGRNLRTRRVRLIEEDVCTRKRKNSVRSGRVEHPVRCEQKIPLAATPEVKFDQNLILIKAKPAGGF